MISRLPKIDASSLRDPEAAVIHYEGRIFRGLTKTGFDNLQAVFKSGILCDFEKNGEIVATQFDISASVLDVLTRQFPQFSFFVEHEKIPFITYPCEWTLAMICDAALLHLDLQLALLSKGFSLKDASPYNVQFIGSKPIFVDLSSFEKAKWEIWPAYGQFCRMFLYPILLFFYRGLETKGLFLSKMDGMSLSDMIPLLGYGSIFSPSYFLDVYLPYFLEKKMEPLKNKPALGPVSISAIKAQLFNIKRLRRLVLGVRNRESKKSTSWIDYQNTHTYDKSEFELKRKNVARFLDDHSPNSIIDFGANTGEFSRLAIARCKSVISIDSDHGSIDRLYRQCSLDKINIQCLWMDLSNPTPSYGFFSTERASVNQRIKADAGFALALIHHLLVTSGIPLDRIADYLWSFVSRYLLVEYVAPDDPQFQSLIGFKHVDFSGLNEFLFEQAFAGSSQDLCTGKPLSTNAVVIWKERLTKYRTLYLLEKRVEK